MAMHGDVSASGPVCHAVFCTQYRRGEHLPMIDQHHHAPNERIDGF